MKHLYRSKEHKVLFGVCGGVADYYEVDPALVRLIFIFLTLATSIAPGVLTYIVGIFMMPKRKHEEA